LAGYFLAIYQKQLQDMEARLLTSLTPLPSPMPQNIHIPITFPPAANPTLIITLEANLTLPGEEKEKAKKQKQSG